jgi:hypothetical protein
MEEALNSMASAGHGILIILGVLTIFILVSLAVSIGNRRGDK